MVLLIEKKFDEAQASKEKLEQMQRDDQKRREEFYEKNKKK